MIPDTLWLCAARNLLLSTFLQEFIEQLEAIFLFIILFFRYNPMFPMLMMLLVLHQQFTKLTIVQPWSEAGEVRLGVCHSQAHLDPIHAYQKLLLPML